MLPCPSCRRPGIFEHSVIISLTEARAAESVGPPMTCYSQCCKCEAVFRREGPDDFFALPPDPPDALGQRVWVIPPWKHHSDEGSFEMSWDVAEAFYEEQAMRMDSLRPIQRLLTELRAAGFGHRLRAGQSLNSLGLSRAREHGLAPGSSHLYLSPNPDGTVMVQGQLGSETVQFGPTEAALAGELGARIEELARLPLE